MFLKKVLVIFSLVSLVNLYVCPITFAKQLTLESGTPINLKVNNLISSESSYIGERVDFNVADDIQVNGETVIKEGTKVIGTISSIEPKGRGGRSGHIDIILNSIKFDNGKIITLYNMIERKGTDRFDSDSDDFVFNVIVSAFFWPVGLYFVCSKGKETIIPVNSFITVINNRDLVFDK